MFVDKEKVVAEAKVILKRAQKMKDGAEVINTKEAEYVESLRKLEVDVSGREGGREGGRIVFISDWLSI